MYKDISKQLTQNSSEIINLSNDSKSIDIPKSDNVEIPKFYFENDTIDASYNIHGTISLSSSTHANLPQPPNEATDLHERPYDSMMSLGEGYIRNDKFLSEELVNMHQTDNISESLELISEERKLFLYCSNEKRFGITFSSGAEEPISQGLLDVDTALNYQIGVMKKVYQFWLNGRTDVEGQNSYSRLFLPPPTESSTDMSVDMESLVKLYSHLDIDGKIDDISKLKRGEVPYAILMEKVDNAIREIVKDYFHKCHGDT